MTPKPVVNDPQGLTVKQGLNELGFSEVADVRVGKYIEVRLDSDSPDEARERVDQMCRKLLANHVIEDFRLEIHGENPGSPHEPPSSQSDAGVVESAPDGRAEPGLPPGASQRSGILQ